MTKKDIYKRVGTLFGHKLGNTFLVSIDSIIISSFLGLTALSLYSNYYYILTAVNGWWRSSPTAASPASAINC